MIEEANCSSQEITVKYLFNKRGVNSKVQKHSQKLDRLLLQQNDIYKEMFQTHISLLHQLCNH